jgi:plasmid stability protein
MGHAGKERRMRKIVVKVPEALDDKLALQARRTRRTKNALVVSILRAALKQNGRGQDAKSAFEAGRDLWGSIEGPGDLSHNPKYLVGYGKPRGRF